MSQTYYPFNPQMGTEDIVMKQNPKTGAVYFTTDTRKIYLDIDKDRSKIPMGGNVGLFYGKMVPKVVVDNQKEFTFEMRDIEGNEDNLNPLIPNVDDLILNSDGCFYKVVECHGEGVETTLTTEKLTIAGSGGGGGNGPSTGGDGSLTSFAASKFNVDNKSILKGAPCNVKFIVKSTNDVGEYEFGEVGRYILYINDYPSAEGPIRGIPSGETTDDISSFADEYVNTIDIAPYLPTGSTTPVLVLYDKNGVKQVSRYLPEITVSSVELTWNYDNSTLNEWIKDTKETMTLEWSVSGDNLEKITYITIGDEGYPREIGRGKGNKFSYNLNFKELNMSHGAHTIKMWVEVIVNGVAIPTKPVYKNIIVAQDNDTSTIISVCLFEKDLKQYNTVAIPIYIFSRNNESGNAVVKLIENGSLKDEWTKVPNLGADPDKLIWSYTPVVTSEALLLTVQSGGQEKTITVSVSGIGVTIKEKDGYAFKFKANEFASNTNVKNWKIGDSTGVSFSDKFDWINGGLQSENDSEGGRRQFFAIKAGSTMTIKYPLFERNAPASGKHFKFIFKTTNCRDYDAQVLSCKIDRKVTHIDKTIEYFLLKEPVVTLTYADNIRLNNGVIELLDIKTAVLDINDKESRKKFANKYVEFDGQLYQCAFIQIDPENNPDEVYNTWYKVTVQDSFMGLLLKAQNGAIKTLNESLEVQYCEDTYIELEVEVTKKSSGKRYIKFWIDGIPCGYTEYSDTDRFTLEDEEIIIGSPDCDVQVYLAKLYESELDIEEHMNNFYMDAPNAEEMIRRYQRNDIMDENRSGEIDLFKLAEKNPDCLVHHYVVPKMPTTKKTKIYPCSYKQYHGDKKVKYYAEGVMIKVQGTSSEKYVVSAANLDTDFDYQDQSTPPTGIINGATQLVEEDGWSMDGGTAIPVKFTCTKVNVASCENVNNMVNQEWYNLFQPYKSVLRCKNPRARDTMQFTPGVLFITDNSTTTSDATGVSNNVFADTMIDGVSYADLPEADRFPKLYSLGQMGNSKNNVHVFHDTSNPLECCVEVADNQMPQQWMVNDNYNKEDIGEKQKFFEFRYPDGASDASQEMKDAWNDFVSWMAHSNPQPKYNKFENITTQEQFDDIAINKKTFKSIPVFTMNSDQKGHTQVHEFNPDINTYYTETDSIYGYTNYLLDEPKTFAAKKFEGFIAENQKDESGAYWQKNYTPMIKGCTIDTYAGTYTHDTYEYRMAKMLDECEEHLVMDSVLYHYLFIERHCMIDNVAKNTFWSTEDCQHWNLIKDYDNDTADGNDNQGKFTRNYGMEPTDMLNPNAKVFNAHQSVWFNFCHGLGIALEWMYDKLENAYVNLKGKQVNVWDYEAYLDYCKDIQSSIPERCWIEDYQRKYFRPNEVYHDNMYNSMLQGGQKKYQRKQYETYQNLYMSSKYGGSVLRKDRLVFRPTGTNLLGIKIPTKVYSDCYIYSEVGGQIAKTRAKRNQVAYLTCPVDNLGNATMYIHPGSNFTKLGSTDPEGQLGHFAPDQMSFAGAKKLREVVYATENSSTINYGLTRGIGFSGNNLLETAYLCNLSSYDDTLDMSDCNSLIKLNCKKSSFKDVSIANGAPTTEIKLENPTALTLKNLSELETLDISNYNRLRSLKLEKIDTKRENLSKNILTSTLDSVDATDSSDYIEYKITDVKWTLSEPSDIDDNHNIKIFDKLLSRDYTQTSFGSDDLTRLPYSTAFTGNVTIGELAYSGNSPLTIYNNYITKDKFANIDLNFESTNAKLYNVIIYDGDGVPYWSKKTVSGTELNAKFLEDGPNGAFDVTKLEKSPVTEFYYKLLPQWTITNGNNESTTINNELPIGISITSDLHIYPTYETTPRGYVVTVKMKHPYTGAVTTLVNPKEYLYGSKLSDIIPEGLVPYANNPNLTLYQAYDFKGYALVEGSSLTVPDTYFVSGPATLWAVFKLEEDIREIVHPEWFKYTLSHFNAPNGESVYGLKITPKVKSLQGKITIPSYVVYEGEEYPVVSIDEFGNNDENKVTQKITHIFMEKRKDNRKNQLYNIEQYAFCNVTSLEYFDFENCAVIYIGSYAFRNLGKLEYIGTFGESLESVGQRAFNQSLTAPPKTTIRIPSTVQSIGTHGFSMLKIGGNCSLEIGLPQKQSELVFTSNGSNEFMMGDENKYSSVTFYSNYYETDDAFATSRLSSASNGNISVI